MNKKQIETAFPLWEAVCHKQGEPPLKVLYEDSEILVCRKAPGFPVQSAHLGVQSVESLLKTRLASAGKSPYVGIIQRLDQPVQGLFTAAKTRRAAAVLSAQLQDGRLHKEYLAVCHTAETLPKPGEWRVFTDYLQKDSRTNTSAVTAPTTPGSKKAVLRACAEEIRIVAGERLALVRVDLQTGRHHQIRVQLAHAGMPIVGDQKYSADAVCPAPGEEKAGLCLCACEVHFVHPVSGKRMKFSI